MKLIRISHTSRRPSLSTDRSGPGVLLVGRFAYSALVRGSLVEWYATWGVVAGLAPTLFLVSLLYRMVVALERIAEKV